MDAALSKRYMNPYSGRVEMLHGLRPTLYEMRKANGPCGPDRALYQPTWWRRVWQWMTKGTKT